MPGYIRKDQVKKGAFDELQAQTEAHNENNDCGVKAVAVVCGVDYDEAHLQMTICGRKHRGSSNMRMIHDAVRAFGFYTKSASYNFITPRLEHLREVRNYRVKNLTTRQLTMFPELLKPEDNYLVYTSGHVVAIKGGQVHCWGATRALQIHSAYEIISKG